MRFVTTIFLFVLSAQVMALLEIEPNNSKAEAQEIILGDTLSGNLYNTSEWDYYKVYVNTTGVLTITITVENTSLTSLQHVIRNADDGLLARDTVRGPRTIRNWSSEPPIHLHFCQWQWGSTGL